jgi:RNA polymerase sigma-70 factor (ECF subfamily)
MKGQNASLQDANTFRRLYERAHIMVYRYIYGSLGGPVQEVEDLTAETFMRAWKARQRFDGDEEAAVGWLIQIAHNLVIDNYRRKKTRGVDEELEETQISVPQAGPEERLLIQEQVHILQWLMQSLTPEQREMIVLRYLLDWPVNRIAEHMDMLENTVSVNLRRILQRLRENWPDG